MFLLAFLLLVGVDDALVTASIISGAASLAATGASLTATAVKNKKQQKFALEQMATQHDYALQDWNRQNEYNKPTAQMERFAEAGLNPNLIYGSNASAGNATMANGVGTPGGNLETPDFSGLTNMSGNIGSIISALSQSKTAEANAEAMSARARLDSSIAEMNEKRNAKAEMYITEELNNLHATAEKLKSEKLLADTTGDKYYQETMNLKTQETLMQVERLLKHKEISKIDAEIASLNAISRLYRANELKSYADTSMTFQNYRTQKFINDLEEIKRSVPNWKEQITQEEAGRLAAAIARYGKEADIDNNLTVAWVDKIMSYLGLTAESGSKVTMALKVLKFIPK